MARSVRLEMNRAGIIELLKSPEVASHLESLGSRVLNQMNSTAPVGETGALSQSHHVEVVEHPTRKVVQVGSDLDYAARVAVGTGYMARALDAAGGP